MFNQRYLTDNEITFISSQINRTKKLLVGLFIIVALIIATVAFFVYSEIDTTNFVINLMFGVLILLLYFLHWFAKGYKEHIIDAKVYKSQGFYKRIYQQHGKNGRYYDTLNSAIIKTPWHWRNYLKSQKESVTFEYIIRDGAVALNEGASMYLISVNDTLSLDYELQNGLHKTKPFSFINWISFVLIIPSVLILCLNPDVIDIQNFIQLTKTEKNFITLQSIKELQQIETPNYIQLNNAWVYQYKLPYDLFGDNYVISKTERDRIYYNPSSHANYRFFLPPRTLKKPEREAYKKQLEKNMQQLGFKQKADAKLWENAVNHSFKIQLSEYNSRLFKAKKMDSILNELKPKTHFFKLYDTCFNAPEKSSYSIKSSLENTHIVRGFYNPKKNKIISFEAQKEKRKEIKNACVLFCICTLIIILFIISLFKMIYNTVIKKRLVEAQLNINHGNPRIEK